MKETQLLRAIFDNLPTAIIVSDSQGRVVMFNRAADTLMGPGILDLPPGGWGEHHGFFLPDQVTRCRYEDSPLMRAARGDEVERAELYIRRPDGSGSIIGATGRQLKDEEGRWAAFVAFWDITQRKRNEHAVSQSELQLKEAQRLARVGSWEWDPVLDIVSWSDEIYRLLGQDPTNPPPAFKDHWKLLSPASFATLNGAVSRALTDGASYSVDIEAPLPDGLPRWLNTRGEIIRGPDIQVVRLRGTVMDITERKQKEKEIALLADRLMLATKAGDIGVWEWDLDTGRLIWDDTMYGLYGHARVDQGGLAYDAWLGSVHPDDRAAADHAVKVALAETGSFDIEVRIVRPDGEVRYLTAQAKLHHDQDGKARRVIGTNTDITERRLSQERMTLLAARLQLATRASRVGIWDRDLSANRMIWDDTMYELYGRVRTADEDVSYESWIDAVHPADRALVAHPTIAHLVNSASLDQQFRIVLPGGEIRHIRSQSILHHDPHGGSQRVIGVNWDFTERKLSEDRMAALADRLQLATRSGRIGVWEWDVQSGRLIWDETMKELHEVAEPLPEDFGFAWWLGFVHPDDRETMQENLRMTIENRGALDLEFRIVLPSGDVRHIQATGTIYYDVGGEPLRAVGTNLDITAVRNLTEALQAEQARLLQVIDQWVEAKQAADAANRAKSAFLASMSHELRTPLNAILGFGQMLQQKSFGALSARQSGYVDAIIDSGGHLLTLIEQILDLSQIESGRLKVTLESTDIRPMVRSVETTLAPIAAKNTVALTADIAQLQIGTVMADTRRLTQALINLGSNAIKYNRPGGRATFTVEAPEAGWIRLVVTDNGIGIPFDRQNEVFQPFNRLDAYRLGIDGVGIGLALTRQIVELMGGRVGFMSEPGRGSTFWIELPAVSGAATAPAVS